MGEDGDQVRSSEPSIPQQGPQSRVASLQRGDEARGSPGSVYGSRSKSSVRKRPSRPVLKPMPSGKYIFSVDDAINDKDTEDDEALKNKERYLEGYKDALKTFYGKSSKNRSNYELNTVEESEIPKQSPIHTSTPGNKRTSIENNMHVAEEALRALESIDSHRSTAEREEDEEENDEEESDGASVNSNGSSGTIESLNLRERQDAINSTHPFGIKIWKPSLYKKNRSVAAKAEEDIHDFEEHGPKGYTWSTRFFNTIWIFTFGFFIFVMCLIGAAFVFLFSGFAINNYSRLYVRSLVRLGLYWLNPFGKFVLLNQDANYLNEDVFDGRSITEFHRWREEEEGRLLFAPPRRNTSNRETRPLLNQPKSKQSNRGTYSSVEEEEDNDSYDLEGARVRRLFGRGKWSPGRIAFYVYFYCILQPVLYILGISCWLIVFMIPMAKITFIFCDHLRRHPLALDFEMEKDYYKGKKRPKHNSILLCTYRCFGIHYYKYTLDGTNVFFINFLVAVVFVIFDFYVLKERLEWDTWFTSSSFLFFGCLFSIIPLAYFIGQSVASISAQSSMGVGAFINAFFSSVVEIYLYCVALCLGKGKLVEGSMIGSILGGVLLLPGLSMIGGAYKRKTQRYNPRSAGVSSTMLLYAMVIMFAPSLFYEIYGSYELRCKTCNAGIGDECTQCRFIQPRNNLDALYYKIIKPFSIVVAIALFLAYVCGLFFTLRTHASLIWATASHEGVTKKDDPSRENFHSPSLLSLDGNHVPKHNNIPEVPDYKALSSREPPSGQATPLNTPLNVKKDKQLHAVEHEGSSSGHDAPNWSRNKSTIILVGATLLYTIIAEILVNNVDAVLQNYPIDPKFLGLTVFALVPNTTEFVNAISFAIGGNVALSMEIGSAYALQVVLIQIPSLLLFTVYKGFANVDYMFTLIFTRWDIIGSLISIYLFTYIYAEGKSNYFKGTILILIYVVVMLGFWYNYKMEDIDDEYNQPATSAFYYSVAR